MMQKLAERLAEPLINTKLSRSEKARPSSEIATAAIASCEQAHFPELEIDHLGSDLRKLFDCH